MKGETQSAHLQKMMQKHKRYPEYDLILPTFSIKKKNLKKLTSGDILLLGLDAIELYFANKGEICAKVKLESFNETVKISIENLDEVILNKDDNKKSEKVYGTLGRLQCRKLEVGHKVELHAQELQYVKLFLFNEQLADKKLAYAKLVSVDDEIAIEITEVNHNG